MTSPTRKRVLFLVPSFTGAGGGAERIAANVLRHLDYGRFECHLAMAQNSAACLESIPKDVHLHRLENSRMRFAMPGLVRLIWRVKPQTVLSTTSHLNILLILLRPLLPRGTRLLINEVTTPSAFIARDVRRPRLWRWLYRHFYPRADKVLCLSDAILKDLADGFSVPRQKLSHIYNPIDAEWMRRLADSGTNPFCDPGPHLLAAGRLRREKGYDLLLRAMPIILHAFPAARLTILGEGPLEGDLREMARSLGITGSVEFAGYRPDPWSYFKHADLFLLSSRFEGMPNVVLEALALGTRVVATDCVAGIREIQEVTDDLVLVSPEDPAALANAVIADLTNPTTFGRNHEQFLRRFDLRRTMEAYSELL